MKHGRLRRIALTLMVALGGGLLPGTCEVRLRDSLVQASKDTLTSFFDPSLLSSLFAGADITPVDTTGTFNPFGSP